MNRFGRRVQKIKEYWVTVFGDGPAAQSCIALSVCLLGALYFVALAWMVPYSIFKAFR